MAGIGKTIKKFAKAIPAGQILKKGLKTGGILGAAALLPGFGQAFAAQKAKKKKNGKNGNGENGETDDGVQKEGSQFKKGKRSLTAVRGTTRRKGPKPRQ